MKPIAGRRQVVATEGDVLDAFTVVANQELFDLTASIGPRQRDGFLVEGDADLAVRRGHGSRHQSGFLALDFESPYLVEIEEPLVVVGPMVHAAPVDVVREMVDHLQAHAPRVPVDPGQEREVDVVDAVSILPAVYEVQGGATDVSDAGQAQFHGAARVIDGLGPEPQRAGVSAAGIANAERETAGAWAVFLREVPGCALGLVVDDEVDASLAPQLHGFGPMQGDPFESEHLEDRLEDASLRGGELDELETVAPHGIGGSLDVI